MLFLVNTEDLRLTGDRVKLDLVETLEEVIHSVERIPPVYILRALFEHIDELESFITNHDKAKKLYREIYHPRFGVASDETVDQFYPEVVLFAAILDAREPQLNLVKAALLSNVKPFEFVLEALSTEAMLLRVEEEDVDSH